MVLKLAVCDDDERERGSIGMFCKSKIEELCDWQVQLYLFADGMELLACDLEFDVLILDIEMKKLDGISVKNHLVSKNLKTKIIFLTSHPEMMSEAFGKNVYGFVDKYSKPEERFPDLLKQIIRDIKEENEYIIASDVNEVKKVRLCEIVYIRTSNIYLEVYTIRSEKYIVRDTMKMFLEEHGKSGFCQIHKSYAVNLRFFRSVSAGKIRLIYNNPITGDEHQEKLPVSRGKCKEIKMIYLDYLDNN